MKFQKQRFPVINTDFYPTLLDLANIPLKPEQHKDGISLKPILEGKQLNFNRPLYWHYPHYGNQGGEPVSIIQEDGWKLIHYWEDGHQELYKLPSTEIDNLNVISRHSELAEKMGRALMNWLHNVGAKYPVLDSEYNAPKAEERYSNTLKNKWPALEKSRLEVLSKDFQPNKDWWKSKVTID